jgi:probable HAF family extracellular repeat protein
MTEVLTPGRIRLLRAAVLAMVALALSTAVDAKPPVIPQYYVDSLDEVALFDHFIVNDLNDSGQIVARGKVHSHAYLIQKNGDEWEIFEVWGNVTPWAISNTGLIACDGYSVDGDLWPHACVLVPEEGGGEPSYVLHDLGRLFFLSDGGEHPPTWATDINDSGVVLGFTEDWINGTRDSYHAFMVVPEDTNSDGAPDTWLRDENSDGINDLMAELIPLDGDHNSAFAYKVNEANKVTGVSFEWKYSSYWQPRAVLWTSPDDVHNLGVLHNWDPYGLDGSWGSSINNLTQVVGWSNYPDSPISGLEHAFLWPAEDPMQDLGLPDFGNLCPDAHPSSWAVDINDDSWIIVNSKCEPEGGAHIPTAIIPMDIDGDDQPDWFYNKDGYSPRQGPNDLMIDLNEALWLGGFDRYLLETIRINAAGQILAHNGISYYLLTLRRAFDKPVGQQGQPAGPMNPQ